MAGARPPSRPEAAPRAPKLRERMLALMDAITLVNSTLELDVALERIMELATRITQAEASAILLVASDTGDLTFHTHVGGADTGQLGQVRVPMEHSLAGWVVKNGKPLRIDDASTDERFYRQADAQTHFTTRSVLAVPLRERDRIIGTVQVLNKAGGAVFDEEDEALLLAMANQAGTAIYNSRTYEDLFREKRTLDAIIGSLADGIVVTVPAGELRQMNEAARQMFGLGAADTSSDLLEVFLGSLQELTGTSADVVLLKPQGRVLSVQVTPFHATRGQAPGLVAALRDVTRLRTGQRRRDEVFAAGLHDLERELADLARKPPEVCAPCLDALHSQVENLTRFSDIEMGPVRLLRRQTALADVLRDALARWKDAAGQPRPSDVQAPADLPEVYVDAKQLCAALQLVLGVCDRLLGPSQALAVSIARSGRRVVAGLGGVSDSADLETTAALLNARAQVEQFLSVAGGHIQLALAYARHVVDSHGGTLDFERVPGGFRFLLAIDTAKEVP